MIRFANISRAADGLELSATTDLDNGFDLKDCRKHMKAILKRARQFPIRSFMSVDALRIYFYTENQICTLMICSVTYPMVLAYGFLNDIHQDFLRDYNREQISRAARPYSFIEFDGTLQKTKQKYNNTRTLATRVDVSYLNDVLKNDPPYQVTGLDIGTGPVSIQESKSGADVKQLVPLTWIGMLGCFLAVCCCFLNILRFVPFWNVHAERTGYESYWLQEFFSLVLSAGVSIGQLYLILHHVSWRNQINVLLLVFNIALIVHLRDLRNLIQMLFLISGTAFCCFAAWHRPLQGKSSNYNV